MWPAVIGALGGMVSAGIGYKGAQKTNQVNRLEAQKNRNFQERMRNTAWQASVADMRAAGLNPALAYSQGPASSPGGTATPPAENPVSSALSSMQVQKTLKQIDAGTQKAQQDARGARAIADREIARNQAYGIEVTPQKGGRDRVKIDLEKGLHRMIQAEILSAEAGAQNVRNQADRNRSLAQISGLPGDAAGGVRKFLNMMYSGAGPAGNELLRRMKQIDPRLFKGSTP